MTPTTELDWTLEHMILDATLEVIRCPLEELDPWLNYVKALQDMKRSAHLNADTFRFYVDQFEAAARDLPKKLYEHRKQT